MTLKQGTYPNGTPRKGPPSRSPTTFPPLQDPATIGQEPGAEGDAFIASDPLAELLGSKGTGYVGEQGDTLPEELVNFLTDNDMGGKRFQVILKQLSEGASEDSTPSAYVKSWYRAVPSIEHIARNYGPGRYAFHISYQGTDAETGKMTRCVERIFFEVSDKYEQEYLEYQRDQKLIAAKKRQEKVRQMKDDRQLDKALADDIGEPVDAKQSAKEYIKEITEVAGQLGLTKQNDPQQKGLMEQIAPFLPLVVPLIQGMLDNNSKMAAMQQQQYQSMMALMLGQAEKSNQQLLEVIKTSQGQGSGSSAVKEFKDMVMGAIDLKQAINGDKDSVMDRVFGLVEAVLPQILTVAAMNKQQQAVDPRVHLARAFVQTNPDFKQVMGDPAKMIEMVTKLDEHYGQEQTDMILAVANIPRPAECPRQQAPDTIPVAEEVTDEQ